MYVILAQVIHTWPHGGGLMKIDTDKKTIKAINQKKIITIDNLVSLLNSSIKTARRRLKSWQAITSYNMNGRYYTLPDIPEFSSHGLWEYRQVRFSQHGNLKNTIIALVNQSKAGLDAAEASDLLGISVRSFLSSLQKHPDFKREKIQGRFVYFSALQKDNIKQKEYRYAMARTIRLPSDIEAIAILVETINNPDLSIDQLALKLQKNNYRISSESIENLFKYHGLSLKKMPDLSF
jgi:hypothetical protein